MAATMTNSVSTISKETPAKGGEEKTSTSKLKKIIKVNLALQILEAYEGGKRIFRFECVTGDKHHPTDRGRFKIFRKRKNHVSGSYHVQMNFAMFFTADGKAVHQYHGTVPLNVVRTARGVSDWFGSHGCVRLIEADAKALFDWTPDHTEICIS